MKTTLSLLLRIWLRLIPFGDLIENVYDSMRQTLFQSNLTKFGNQFAIINRIAFSYLAHGTVIASSIFHKPVFTPSAELTGVQQVFF